MPIATSTRLPLLAFSGWLIIGGCAKYQAFSLDPLRPEFHASAITVDSIGVCMETLDAVRSKRCFNKNLSKIGYQPIQFTVANGPGRYLTLNTSLINLSGADPSLVAERCHFSTAGRAAAYGVPGLIIWPLLIPAVVDGVGSSKANMQMDMDFNAKALKDQVILPHGSANGVLFVPTSEVTPDVVMRLVDRDSGDSFVFRWASGTPIGGTIEKKDASTRTN